MPAPQTETDTRRRLNPLFNDNKLKLGLFGVNVSNARRSARVDGTPGRRIPSTVAIIPGA
jgi:hypothetical protein